MNQLERLAGRAALLLAVGSGLTMIVALVVLPAYGLRKGAELADATTVLRLALPLVGLEVLKLFRAGATVALVLGLSRAWPSKIMGWAAWTGLLSALLLGLSGLLGVLSLPPLQRFGADTAPINALINGLGQRAVFVTGVWALLVGYDALRLGRLPRGFAYLGLVWGAAGVLALVLAPLALVALFLGLLWQVGVGLTLWRGLAAAAGRQRA